MLGWCREFSSLALNNSRIGIVTGTKVLIDSIIEANENSLTKYMRTLKVFDV